MASTRRARSARERSGPRRSSGIPAARTKASQSRWGRLGGIRLTTGRRPLRADFCRSSSIVCRLTAGIQSSTSSSSWTGSSCLATARLTSRIAGPVNPKCAKSSASRRSARMRRGSIVRTAAWMSGTVKPRRPGTHGASTRIGTSAGLARRGCVRTVRQSSNRLPWCRSRGTSNRPRRRSPAGARVASGRRTSHPDSTASSPSAGLWQRTSAPIARLFGSGPRGRRSPCWTRGRSSRSPRSWCRRPPTRIRRRFDRHSAPRARGRGTARRLQMPAGFWGRPLTLEDHTEDRSVRRLPPSREARAHW